MCLLEYCHSSPARFVDPSGRAAVPEPDKDKAPGTEGNPGHTPPGEEKDWDPWVDEDLEKLKEENPGWRKGPAHKVTPLKYQCYVLAIFGYKGMKRHRYAFVQYAWVKIEWGTKSGKRGGMARSTVFVPDTRNHINTFYPTQRSVEGSEGSEVVMHDKPGLHSSRAVIENSEEARRNSLTNLVEEVNGNPPLTSHIMGDEVGVARLHNAVDADDIAWLKITVSFRTWLIDLNTKRVVHEWRWGYWSKLDMTTGEYTNGTTGGRTL